MPTEKQTALKIYNTLSRKKESFQPLSPPFVGMYVCGPTVYGYAHLGHAKSYVSFDVIYRYLLHLNYKIRYVQNITDVGHLTDDADEGEDKIQKQSRLEFVEPMEVVEKYMAAYYRDMDALNILRPSIAPRPSGHIPEQIKAIKALIDKGFAYEAAGSVYFDVIKYDQKHHYGKLSGRKVEELMQGTADRELQKQSEKRNSLDFALWKKVEKGHLMSWDSPWGKGYPGWHIECSVMSQKYLGKTLDIHGGGMENIFPHHECEIAQSEALTNKPFAKYWLHNNMVTVNGQKMGKSLGNSISCQQLFNGGHTLLEQAYSPMTIRFFILQSHYRSTLDFSNAALKAAEKGYKKLIYAYKLIHNLKEGKQSSSDIKLLLDNCYKFMNDDFNTTKVIAELFEGVRIINSVHDGHETITKEDIHQLKTLFDTFVIEILGLKPEENKSNSDTDKLMQLIIDIRNTSKKNKDYAISDRIRDELKKLHIRIKDEKDGTTSFSIEQ